MPLRTSNAMRTTECVVVFFLFCVTRRVYEPKRLEHETREQKKKSIAAIFHKNDQRFTSFLCVKSYSSLSAILSLSLFVHNTSTIRVCISMCCSFVQCVYARCAYTVFSMKLSEIENNENLYAKRNKNHTRERQNTWFQSRFVWQFWVRLPKEREKEKEN